VRDGDTGAVTPANVDPRGVDLCGCMSSASPEQRHEAECFCIEGAWQTESDVSLLWAYGTSWGMRASLVS